MCREPAAIKKSDDVYLALFLLMLFSLLGGMLYSVWLKCCDLFEVIIDVL